MRSYFVTRRPDEEGFHRLHTRDCLKCYLSGDNVYIGDFETCEQAIERAERLFPAITNCPGCLKECFPVEEPPYVPPDELFE